MNDKVVNIDTIEDLELAAYYIKNFSQVKK